MMSRRVGTALSHSTGSGIGVNYYSLPPNLSNGTPGLCSILGFCNVGVYVAVCREVCAIVNGIQQS